MASIGMIMTKGDDIELVILMNTPPNDLIGIVLEQIRIILEKALHHGHKLGLILSPPMQRYLASDKIVHYISKPWCLSVSNVYHLLIKEVLKDGGGIFSEIHSQPRQMISHHIFGTLLIPNLYFKLF
jgi:hypothetical protein